ncbi:HflK protein [Bathymodiolus brooksi thiotrophic gill symbiont]|jgi:membrane protease subunit HflK|nr:HflK protein [Bathymodiolus brooksi thiotrophic gill symbiont]CAB9544636.1 HflK protein [Bathymodiolus brooksi thiotrophic gill symbiont]SHE20856.1 HflK protein [Bathymodiolus brooksi thiotrophic gill symbiont]
MSWNEPGGDKKKDPWSGRDTENTPPDLDEAMRSLQNKLGGLFGGGKNSGDNNGGSAPSLKGLGFLAIGAVALWSASGFYIVDEGNRGVEMRFGEYVATTQPGLNWHFPSPIEKVELINISQQRFLEVGYRSGGSRQRGKGSVPKEALMLTKDENIVDIRLAIQYQVNDAKKYLFNIKNQTATLKQVTESSERGVIGANTMDFILTEGRSQIVADIEVEIQKVMDSYDSGILITSVNLQDAQPPEQVQSAFEDAIKAREDKQRLINEAEAYANEVVPKARGAAARLTQEAEGYKSRIISAAEGDVSRFSQILKEYKKAPEVTRKRIYLDTMEAVMSGTDTVLVDVKGSNNMMYLPLDKLVDKSSNRAVQQQSNKYTSTTKSAPSRSINQPRSSRGRVERGR